MLWLVRVSSLLQPIPVHIHQTSDDLRIIDKWHISWLVDNTRTDRQDLIIIISWPVQLHKIYLTSDIHTDRQTYVHNHNNQLTSTTTVCFPMTYFFPMKLLWARSFSFSSLAPRLSILPNIFFMSENNVTIKYST